MEKRILRIIRISLLIFIMTAVFAESKKDDRNMAKDIAGLEEHFVKTGGQYKPLAEDTPIEVFLESGPQYEIIKIGIVSVGEKLRFKFNNLSSHIKMAKIFARSKGADIIILRDTTEILILTGVCYAEKVVHTFEIARRKHL